MSEILKPLEGMRHIVYEGDTMPSIDWKSVIKATIDKAILEERERCAKIAENTLRDNLDWTFRAAGLEIAAAIRGTSNL